MIYVPQVVYPWRVPKYMDLEKRLGSSPQSRTYGSDPRGWAYNYARENPYIINKHGGEHGEPNVCTRTRIHGLSSIVDVYAL